ncbi:conserved hypothetical protein [Candidatus Desulfarcum epimagneticum]|uniref:DUF8180 domain-containing protein n=1 Tax=uncultured Desulfobacteraceae bacterium TaxID=218296 RepID=A0A484HLT3_9BACT|nr:conserved hypothetical protein [uncultured Desulfobacteraceae bacterium]
MSHSHTPHSHSHSGAGHSHDEPGAMSFPEKMARLLEHWIAHNEDHAASYRDWAGKAGENHIPEAKALLEEAAEMTGRISEKFERAAGIVKKI